MALSADNMIIMCIMVAVVLLLIVFFFGRTKKKIVPIYLAGANEGDNLRFHGIDGQTGYYVFEKLAYGTLFWRKKDEYYRVYCVRSRNHRRTRPDDWISGYNRDRRCYVK